MLYGNILEKARENPDAIAVYDTHSDAVMKKITYRDLVNLALRIANSLDVPPAVSGENAVDSVAIAGQRSIPSIAAMLGIMFSGRAFHCVNIDYDAAMIEQFLDNTRPCAMIHTDITRVQKSHDVHGDRILAADRNPFKNVPYMLDLSATIEGTSQGYPYQDHFPGDKRLQLNSTPMAEAEINNDPGTIAHIHSTSGSTGEPKAVPMTHENTLRFYAPYEEFYAHMRKGAGAGCRAPFSFNVAPYDIFAGALRQGRPLVILDETVTTRPKELQDLIKQYDIGSMFELPSAVAYIAGQSDRQNDIDPLPQLELLLLTGEKLSSALTTWMRANMPETFVYEGYGSTEADSTADRSLLLPAKDLRGIANQNIQPARHIITTQDAAVTDALLSMKARTNIPHAVLTDDGRIVTDFSAEVEGELLLAANYIMAGYMDKGHIQETPDYYIDDPDNNTRWFRTGDAVAMRNTAGDTKIDIRGRKGSGVKIDGYYTSLEDMEDYITLNNHRFDAVVVFDRPNQTFEILCVGKNGRDTPEMDENVAGEIIELAKQRTCLSILSAEAVSFQVQYYPGDDFPRTSSGKLDRQELEKQLDIHNSSGNELNHFNLLEDYKPRPQ